MLDNLGDPWTTPGSGMPMTAKAMCIESSITTVCKALHMALIILSSVPQYCVWYYINIYSYHIKQCHAQLHHINYIGNIARHHNWSFTILQLLLYCNLYHGVRYSIIPYHKVTHQQVLGNCKATLANLGKSVQPKAFMVVHTTYTAGRYSWQRLVTSRSSWQPEQFCTVACWWLPKARWLRPPPQLSTKPSTWQTS